MIIRCLFRVTAVCNLDNKLMSGENKQQIVMVARYETEDGREVRFAEGYPVGDLQFQLSNRDLLGQFRPGQEFTLQLEARN